MKATLLILVCASLLVACSKDSDNKSAGPVPEVVHCADYQADEVGIVGGKVLSGNSRVARGTVFILQALVGSDGEFKKQSLCTGSILDNDVILTAAHCVDGDFKDKSRNDTVMVAVSTKAQPLCDRSTFLSSMQKAHKIEIHKGWEDSSESESTKSDDIALLRVSQLPDEAMPFHISKEFVNPLAHRVFSIGFGDTIDYNHDDRVPIVLRYVELDKITEATSDRVADKILAKNKATREQCLADLECREELKKFKQKFLESKGYEQSKKVFEFDQTTDRGICSGDSGGPSVVVTNSKAFVVGIHAYVVGLDGKTSCHGLSGITSVHAYKDWIVEKYRKLKNLKESDSIPFLK